MPWSNGYIPDGDLVRFGRSGYNDTDKNWYWALTGGTLARVYNLIAIAKRRTGRELSPGDGWSTYRPYWAQVIARQIFGNGAAWPGSSSHGGFWEGRETLAVDFSNWSWVYSGNRQAFYDDCRAAGLTPGMIEPYRGYPDEPWHVIDMNPRAGAPSATPAGPTEEEELMSIRDDLISVINQWGTSLQAQIHDRRGVVVVWTPVEGANTPDDPTDDFPRTAWVVDHGAGTKRNVAKGIDTYENAIAYVDWLGKQGIPVLEGDQPPAFLAGYRDISND